MPSIGHLALLSAVPARNRRERRFTKLALFGELEKVMAAFTWDGHDAVGERVISQPHGPDHGFPL